MRYRVPKHIYKTVTTAQHLEGSSGRAQGPSQHNSFCHLYTISTFTPLLPASLNLSHQVPGQCPETLTPQKAALGMARWLSGSRPHESNPRTHMLHPSSCPPSSTHVQCGLHVLPQHHISKCATVLSKPCCNKFWLLTRSILSVFDTLKNQEDEEKPITCIDIYSVFNIPRRRMRSFTNSP